jgi:amino acid adenylation domain-containing protein/FkbM family methyltransferase
MKEEITEGFRLSPQQRRVWQTHQAYPAWPLCVQAGVRIAGAFHIDSLKAALQAAVDRYEILRTSFHYLPGLGVAVQTISRHSAPVIEEFDLTGLDESLRLDRAESLFVEMIRRPIRLEQPSPLSARILRVSETEHQVFFNLPAICCDRVGLDLLCRKVFEHYEAGVFGENGEEELCQYADLAEWANELLESDDGRVGADYWGHKNISLPIDFRLPFEKDLCLGNASCPEWLTVRIPDADLKRLKACALNLEGSVSVLLLACWKALLRRLTTDSNVAVGVTFDGRKYEDLSEAIGLFAVTLPIDDRIEEDARFDDLARRLKGSVDECRQWQEFFRWDRLRPKSGRIDVFSELPYLFEYEEGESRFAVGDSLKPIRRFNCYEKCRVKLSCRENDGALTAVFEYDPNVIDAAEIGRLGERYLRLIRSVCEDPGRKAHDLEIIGERERSLLLYDFNDTGVDYPADSLIHQSIQSQAENRGHAVAVTHGEENLTYHELCLRAHQTAAFLKKFGAGPEVTIGLLIEPSIEMIIGILGILKTGGAYLPLDPSFPEERLAYMLNDCGAPVLLTTRRLSRLLNGPQATVICIDKDWDEIAHESVAEPRREAMAENVAYMIYTSGSSGRPKGVQVTHRGLLNSIYSRHSYYSRPVSSFLLLSSIAFDSSVAGIFWTLSQGGRLRLLEEGQQRDPSELWRLIVKDRITHMLCLPSLYLTMLHEVTPGNPASLEVVIVAGEPCPRELISFHDRHVAQAELFNEYGPTEATVWSSVYNCRSVTSDAPVSIGKPIANAQIYLTRPDLRLAPHELSGELLIGGAGLARGYWRSADLTADKFIPNPFSKREGARLYRSGDLARYLPDGNLEFIGRADHQVKLRGYRIELHEIETVIDQHPMVRQSVVEIWGDDAINSQRLVTYFIPDERRAFTALRLLQIQKEGLISDARQLYRLPDGATIFHQNKNETDYLYKEIFDEQTYLQRGIGLEDGDCVFDVGANIGMFTLFVGRSYPNCLIYAFEPVPPIFKLLQLNASIYGLKVKLFDFGLAGEEAVDTIKYYPHLSLMSGRYVDEKMDRDLIKRFEMRRLQRQSGFEELWNEEQVDEVLSERLIVESFPCRLRTISQVIREQGVERIDLLKIDVEKSELETLRGIEPHDWEKIRQLVIESQSSDGQLEKIVELLESQGFTTVVEQDYALSSAGLFKVYARRPGARSRRGDRTADQNGSRVETTVTSLDQLIDNLRKWLGSKLPDFMIPSAFVPLSEFPRLPNGKIDRRALPQPSDKGGESADSKQHSRSPVEEIVAGIWSEVLKRERIDVFEDFFSLGGHSLLAAQVIARVRKIFKIEIPVLALFRSSTVAGLARVIEAAIKAEAAGDSPPLIRVSRDQPLPLSYSQQRLWFLNQLAPSAPLYHVPLTVRIDGELDIRSLRSGIDEIVKRHEILRSSFSQADGQPTQIINQSGKIELQVIDATSIPDPLKTAEILRITKAEILRPFDLSQGPLARAILIHAKARTFFLVATMHHIISDGWSMGVLMDELTAHYEASVAGKSANLDELEAQYADYACWERSRLQGAFLQEMIDYWRKQLDGAPQSLMLRTDRLKTNSVYYAGGRCRFRLNRELTKAIGKLCRQEGVTPFMALLSAFDILLHHYSGQEDIVIGVPTANRNRIETERLIGFFINTLLIRTDLSGDPEFRELLSRARDTALKAYAHQELPFDKLVEALQPDRSLDHSPLFQVWFVLQNAPMSSSDIAGLSFTAFDPGPVAAKYDLKMSLTETDDGIVGSLEYKTDLFFKSTVEIMTEQYRLILESVTEQPERRLKDIVKTLADYEHDCSARRVLELQKFSLQKLAEARRVYESPVNE